MSAKDRKWDNGAAVVSIFRKMFDGARRDGHTVVDGAVTAGLGCAVFMALTRVSFEEEPTNEQWDAALALLVSRLIPRLEPEVLREAVEEVRASAKT